MRNSKQLEKERVVVSAAIPVELYFCLKFEGEKLNASNMSDCIRKLLERHFDNKAKAEQEADADA